MRRLEEALAVERARVDRAIELGRPTPANQPELSAEQWAFVQSVIVGTRRPEQNENLAVSIAEAIDACWERLHAQAGERP